MKKIDITPLKNALITLKESITISEKYIRDPKTEAALKQTLEAGVIQHFEFCYELSFKMLKRQLEQTSPTPADVDRYSYQELIREGAEKGYIQDPKKWLDYRHQRNLTSHTYREDYAKEVYRAATCFYQDAYNLLLTLQAKIHD